MPQLRSAATKSGPAAAPAASPSSRRNRCSRASSSPSVPEFRVPHDERQVVPAQRIADRGGCRIDVDGLVRGQDLAHPQGAKAVLVLQPSFAFVFVDGDDLLRHPVDVLEQRGGDRLDHRHPHRFRDIDRAQFGEDQLIHPALTEPIGAHQRVDGHPVLRQSAGVLQRRGGRLDTLDRDVVAQRVQDRVHVALDAGPEQLHQPRVAAQLGDLILEGTTNRRRHVGQPVMQSGGDLGDVTAHLDIAVEVRFLHLNDVRRRGCLPGDNCGRAALSIRRLCRGAHDS